ncbi:MAG: ferrochelatase [Novosphingobium pentaromativorans]|uniref:Ferrochelatase n=1 Tax=Novosphingobium pentaromativorans TaxID=205844 RepID=A0A2W5P2W3_9SPHN|nr:MAG: ferrochelatase [Novosphingobium pentaromativorans]
MPAHDQPADSNGAIGVLLVNLGTPDAPTAPAVRRYLAEFLSDPRVVEIPAIAWKPILHGVILRTRPAKSAHAYAQVWTEEGSPLAAITRAQALSLKQKLGARAHVDWAMRYGNPSIPARLQAMMEAGCDRVLVAPLYPQYSGATTASVMDKLGDALSAMRAQPAIRTLPPYYADAAYIDALEADLLRQLDALDFVPEVLLLSYHGMPQRTADLGDPYYRHCLETSRLLGGRLAQARPDIRIETSFQSRFGRAKWLEPSTEDVLAAEAKAGTRRIAIAAPGFSADCVETLEELAIRGREVFEEAGGTRIAVLSCLNDGKSGMEMLEALVLRELSGWLDESV